jgi:hypothetical protein
MSLDELRADVPNWSLASDRKVSTRNSGRGLDARDCSAQ